MKHSIEFKETTNRYIYNRLYKFRLEKHGKIKCCYCPYHRIENDSNKWYGTLFNWNEPDGPYNEVRYPSWKLATKNRKQWMDKKLKKKLRKNPRFEYFEFKF